MHYPAAPDSGFLSEAAFIRRLHVEQRRTERSQRPFILTLVESDLFKEGAESCVSTRIFTALSTAIRETDVCGWHKNGAAIGLIFTEIGPGDCESIGNVLIAKLRRLVTDLLGTRDSSRVALSFYVFPADWDKLSQSAAVLYPRTVRERKSERSLKRVIDIGGSLAALIIAFPLFAIIAAAIKLTSKGPVLFSQERVGQYGSTFRCLKFRSMFVDNDHGIHREYVKNLIAGAIGAEVNGATKKVFKLTDDPRVTRVGRFLRRTSLDEIPQFWNVLRGQMSLVGPRPPVLYEVEAYKLWHRRRLLEVKPGITGLWQVKGRSRTSFDEMVRLDLQYARSWSVWKDLNILLRTPAAVVAGDGAY
jgi:exopolysaccharide biosynthesis polyprenyl glycosylphosphotransferase